MKNYEIRDPIHGFIKINEWEREIINHPIFQRLRRIKQLAWTDMVYPGAMHTRFEHSLGVMHAATKMFNAIIEKDLLFLQKELNYNEAGIKRDLALLRIACLLHDVGHLPFSHAGEDLMPTNPKTNKAYKHEHYSAAIIRHFFKEVIEQHPINQKNYQITAEQVARFIEGSLPKDGALIWRDLLSSQLDADRADYLLRDSYHCGVAYGKYDLDRLIISMTIGINEETGAPLLAVEEGGVHVAEALILARYQMFTQVYFHHTRRAYDYHIIKLMKILLENEQKNDLNITEKDKFPPPDTKENLQKYLKWDDWKVLGIISRRIAKEEGEVFLNRNHFRNVYSTLEIPTKKELTAIGKIEQKFKEKNICYFVDRAEQSWYKLGEMDIAICIDTENKKTVPLSSISNIIRNLKPIMQQRIFVPIDEVKNAKEIIKATIRRGKK